MRFKYLMLQINFLAVIKPNNDLVNAARSAFSETSKTKTLRFRLDLIRSFHSGLSPRQNRMLIGLCYVKNKPETGTILCNTVSEIAVIRV